MDNGLRIQVQELQLLLIRRISGSQAASDEEHYANLRVDIIIGIDAEKIPTILLIGKTLIDLDDFIGSLSMTSDERIDYIKEQFAPLTSQKGTPLANLINLTISDTKKMSSGTGLSNPDSKTSKAIKYTWGVISLIVALATLYSFYLQLKENKPRMQISQNMVNHLTIPPRIAGIRATYYYRDSVVSDLWKLDVTVTNIGAETIIAVGPKRNVMPVNGLEMVVRRGFRILDIVRSNGNLPVEIKVKNDSTIILAFEQWRKSEEVQISLYLERESSTDKNEPALLMSERQIVDGKIENIPYRLKPLVSNPVLADFLPQPITKPLRWSLIAIFSMMSFLILPLAAISEAKGKTGKLKKVLPFIVFSIFCILPLLWIVHKFW